MNIPKPWDLFEVHGAWADAVEEPRFRSIRRIV
ncbi:hypothetical protein NITGR_950054 [Nitrospina gracilis 3/211]|uniref:Uncharacterized protein n=1 Tax=Nitrospina gracilis (strain 3/211) TaxID=1266370 RepID=M1Z276_NITG3|nr:hypothetical protein NITGR_950054 [Nitrospina gracilis 3/211]